ncbi:MAG: hypothetical protein JWP12_3228 [Bacteroidetes bacterium]|nr:hypothetical protein [Bacteroidota bacterium]
MILQVKYITLITVFTSVFCFSCNQQPAKKIKGEINKNDSLTEKAANHNDIIKEHDSIYCKLKSTFLNLYTEPDLQGEENETYRFIWIAPLDNTAVRSAAFRITEINNHYKFIVKYSQKGKIVEVDKELTKEQWIEFMASINATYFWSLQISDDEIRGGNPSSWYLEGKRNKKYYRDGIGLYHIVYREEPYIGCFRESCETLVKFAKIDELSKSIK